MNPVKKVLFAIITTVSLLTAGVNTPLSNVGKKDEVHLIVLYDVAGLNSSCPTLRKKNIDYYEKVFKKRKFKKKHIKSATYLTFSSRVELIGTAVSRRSIKTYRLSLPYMNKVKNRLHEDNSMYSKDIFGAINYVSLLASQYENNTKTKVVILMFSNLFDTSRSKEELKKITPIKLSSNTSMIFYHATGVQCLKNSNSSMSMSAAASYKRFVSSKVLGNVKFYSIYGGKN